MSALSAPLASGTVAGGSARPVRVPVRPGGTPGKAAPKRVAPLKLVPQARSSAARAPFVIVVVALLVAGLLGLLLLNTLVAQDSFALHDLAKQGKTLEQQEQALTRQVQDAQAPAALAAQAARLGMVPGGPPAFLRLSDGRVLGLPTAGVAPVVPVAPKASTTWTAPKPSPAPGTAKASTVTTPVTAGVGR